MTKGLTASSKQMTESGNRSNSAEKRWGQATFGKEDVSLFHKQNFDEEAENTDTYPSSPRLQGALKDIERKVIEISQGIQSSNLREDLNNIERRVLQVNQDVNYPNFRSEILNLQLVIENR